MKFKKVIIGYDSLVKDKFANNCIIKGNNVTWVKNSIDYDSFGYDNLP